MSTIPSGAEEWAKRVVEGEFASASAARKSLSLTANKNNWPEESRRKAEKVLLDYFNESEEAANAPEKPKRNKATKAARVQVKAKVTKTTKGRVPRKTRVETPLTEPQVPDTEHPAYQTVTGAPVTMDIKMMQFIASNIMHHPWFQALVQNEVRRQVANSVAREQPTIGQAGRVLGVMDGKVAHGHNRLEQPLPSPNSQDPRFQIEMKLQELHRIIWAQQPYR